MQVKDYYKILELQPNATPGEVKKNFRRLALRYHPDTNQGNRYAEAWYREIQEAYETLSDVSLREAYHQQRWLIKSEGRSFCETVPLTPAFILKQANELLEQVKQIDHFRMDHAGLQQKILMVVDDERIDVLNTYMEEAVNLQVAHTILDCLYPLEFPYLKPVIKQLHKITDRHHMILPVADRYFEKRRTQWLWEKYQGLIIFFITILLCLVIYVASR
jgi:preprotein translocase subunit Sec63